MARDGDRIPGKSRHRWSATAWLTGSLGLHLLLVGAVSAVLAGHVSPSGQSVKTFEVQPVSEPQPQFRDAARALTVPVVPFSGHGRISGPRPRRSRAARTVRRHRTARTHLEPLTRKLQTVRPEPVEPPVRSASVGLSDFASRQTTLQEEVASSRVILADRSAPGPKEHGLSGGGPARPARRTPQTARSGGLSGPDRAAVAMRIRRALRNVLVYPLRARQMGLEGKVVLSFRIDASGRASHVHILHSAGPLLDRAAVAALHRAEPLPRFSGEVSVPLRFRLDQ